MPKRKHHIILGIMCLLISIILPTLIYNYYIEIKSLCETTVDYSVFDTPIRYGGLSALLLIWLVSLVVALRELGGSMIQLVDDEHKETNYI